MTAAPHPGSAKPRRRTWVTSVASASLLTATGCVPASPGPSTYEDKAELTVESALSEVATVQLTVGQLSRGRALRPAVLTQLRYSEDGVDAASRAFTDLNPPPADDRLHDRTDTLLTAAGDTLEQTRIAVVRNDRRQYPALIRDLGRLAARLENLGKQVGS